MTQRPFVQYAELRKRERKTNTRHGLAIVFLCLTFTQCFAMSLPPPPSSYSATASGSSRTDTRLYAGLGWAWGAKAVFETMIGIRTARVDSSGKVSGTDLSASLPFPGMTSVKVKARYINGTTNGQGEIGMGYAFGPGQFLGTAGYSLPYLDLGTDYVLNQGFEPFAGVNTMGRLNTPSPTYSCLGAPATLIGTSCNPTP